MSDKQVIKDNPQEQELGNVTVSKEVVAVIAALETIKTKGVVGITSGHRGKSPNLLSRKDLAKGVEVWMKPGEAAITIPIITAYEVGIFKVAEEVQHKVKNAICSMTDLKVLKVDVNVQGIKFKEEKKKIKKETQKE
ncbi:MAG: Asp23/Gls24 family envelope stress response protein [bacterium]|nr:Asp23/Gls24 family envelope stress response protein [bacterium]MBU1427653.1 Asp23/Gls24 family envelope stress response protein [bacterium]MBU2439665.1 Asp23/Gls24 family envelope stress response protein [bacterium]